MKSSLAPLVVIIVFVGSLIGLGFTHLDKGKSSSTIVQGRQVYISEGCIHCHSQYSRIDTLDTERWGPSSLLPDGSGDPVLIGNRRQGPDLSNVGLRRSREWNRAHLISPRELSPGSRMPGYGHLFENGRSPRGEALLDYLQSLEPENLDVWQDQVYGWSPSVDLNAGNLERGKESFSRNCQQCHGPMGRGDGPATSQLASAPRDLVAGIFLYAPDEMNEMDRERRLAQIIKYGQSGTSMPGHESLTDDEIVDLVAYLNFLRTNFEAE